MLIQLPISIYALSQDKGRQQALYNVPLKFLAIEEEGIGSLKLFLMKCHFSI